MFWKGGDEPAQATPALDGSSAPIDAEAEKQRITALTGDKEIVIQREGKSRIKLPGL